MTHDQILGYIFEFHYSDEAYRIEILSEDQVRWTRTAGNDVGKTDVEAYVFSAIDAGKIMLTWIEADGLGLSNVLDPGAGTLTTHANMGRDVFVNEGKLIALAPTDGTAS